MRAEQERRSAIEAAMRDWLSSKTWPPLDAVDRFLIQARLVAVMRVLRLLTAAPVYAQDGPYDLIAWILFVDWERSGRETWQIELETYNAWYEAGLDDARARAFPA